MFEDNNLYSYALLWIDSLLGKKCDIQGESEDWKQIIYF